MAPLTRNRAQSDGTPNAIAEEYRRLGAPLNAPDQATFYGGGVEGYIDYPFPEREAA